MNLNLCKILSGALQEFMLELVLIHVIECFRSNCFGSEYFKGCLDALLLNEEAGKFDEMIEILGKKK